MFEENNQAVWTFDWAELQLIFEIKKAFVYYRDEWDLENAYWKILSLRAELDAKLSRGRNSKVEEQFEKEHDKEKKKLTEKEECDELVNQLGKERIKFNESNQEDKEKADFYNVLNNFYMYLCRLMKIHGLYFKEGGDNKIAVLRR